MIPASRCLLRLLLASVLLSFTSAGPVLCQSRSQVADSMKKVIADHRVHLHTADSLGDKRAAIDIRSRLAVLVKPKETAALLRDAVAIADSADLMEEEIVTRMQLAEHYQRAGNHKLAYAEAIRIVALGNERHSAQAEEAGQRADLGLANATAERDSLQRTWQEELANVTAAGSMAEERGRHWMWTSTGIGVLFVLTLVVVLYRSGRSNQRIRTELGALRAEITALKEQRPTNQVRVGASPLVPLSEPIVVPVAVPASGPSQLVEADPVVLAMFRKMGPERLATLRDARTRGDHPKVVRVVHSLKPQLVNFDRDRFTDLCARITATDGPANEVRWSADLDALEKGISEVLSGIGH